MADDAAAPDGELIESEDEAKDTAETAETEAAAETEATEDGDAEDGDAEETVEDKPARPRMSDVRLATMVGLLLVVVLAALTGWLGYRAYESHRADEERKLFLQVGRQGALNLTTIDFQSAEADVQRILDSATGTFYDDFQKRAQPFIEVVKQAQSKSVGTIAEAGLESESGNQAQVLLAVTVKTSNGGAPEQQPRSWRMRITVEKTGDDDEVKVSNVEFVP